MRLLCHDVGCEGHDLQAGTDPGGDCRFCHRPLADGHGVLLVGALPERTVLANLIAMDICARFGGHSWEGHIPRRCEELRGFCSRCGVTVTLAL